MDCFYLPKLEGKKRYCFVAIDRATRLAYLAVYAHKNKEAADRQWARVYTQRLQEPLPLKS